MKLFVNIILLSTLVSASGKFNSNKENSQNYISKNSKNCLQKNDIEKFKDEIKPFVEAGKIDYHQRVSRWFTAKKATQDKFVIDENLNWFDGGIYPEMWPTMIHRFSKELDKNLLKYGIFTKTDPKNIKKIGQKDTIIALLPAKFNYEKDGEFNSVDGIIEYGFNSKTTVPLLYHRYFRALDWNAKDNMVNDHMKKLSPFLNPVKPNQWKADLKSEIFKNEKDSNSFIEILSAKDKLKPVNNVNKVVVI